MIEEASGSVNGVGALSLQIRFFGPFATSDFNFGVKGKVLTSTWSLTWPKPKSCYLL